jgi:ubiquitin
MTTTTQMGVADAVTSTALTEDDAAGTFLSRWSDKDPSVSASVTPENEDERNENDEVVTPEAEETHEADEVTETDPAEQETETESETESDDESTQTTSKVADDDAVATVQFDGKDLQVSVKDLKRLYGQEAALTKKSQEVADQRRVVEESNQKAAAQLDRLHAKATARWEPYAKIDMLVASKQLDNEQFAALRAEAQAAFEDYRFITQEVEGFVKETNAARERTIKETAQRSVKYLSEKIPGWNQQVYDDVRAYAVSTGMPQRVVDGICDHFSLEMIHKAMQYDKAKSVTTTKVVKTPKKVLTTTAKVPVSQTKADATAKARKQAQQSGTTEDAANLFLARWSK